MNLVDSQYRSTSSSNMLINTCTTARIASAFLPSLYKQRTTNFIQKRQTGDREIQFTIKHIEVCNNSTEVYQSINILLSPEGEVNSGGYIPRRKVSRYIYPPLFTDPEGDSCFSIYQIRWIKKCCFNFFF